MPAKDVKAYVKRNKNDAADAAAICEAVRRPTMRFVQVKSVEQQGQLMLHRTRDLLMRQRTQVINALRAHMAELGIVFAQGREGLKELLKIIASEAGCALAGRCSHEPCRVGGGASGDADDDWIGRETDHGAASLERGEPAAGEHPWDWSLWARPPSPPRSRIRRFFDRVATSRPGSGSYRAKTSTGGKQKLGPISKQGDRYLRRILVVGAHAVLKRARQQPEKYPWLTQLLARKPFKVVAVALANKMARIAWALLAKGGPYRAPALAAAA